MAKKNKKVQISTEPLAPTTVGQINQHKFGFILILFLFAAMFAAVMYLPNLEDVYEEVSAHGYTTFDKLLDVFKNGNEDDENPVVEKDNSIILTTTSEFKSDKINIKSVSFKDNTVSVVIENLTDSGINLEDLDLKIQFVGTEKTYDYLLTGIVKANDTLTSEYEVEETVSSYLITQNSLICQKGDITITYYFDDDDKLIKVVDIGKYATTSSEYETKHAYYQRLVDKYTDSEIIYATVTDNEDNFEYELDINYNKGDIKFSNENYFTNGETSSNVKTKMEENNFTCK